MSIKTYIATAAAVTTLAIPLLLQAAPAAAQGTQYPGYQRQSSESRAQAVTRQGARARAEFVAPRNDSVYVGGRVVGADPDPFIRNELRQDFFHPSY